MAEDTSPDGATSEPGQDDGTPEANAKEPSVSSTTADAPQGEDEPEGLDPQLIALCVLLWVAALGLFVFKWPSLRADWYLGDVMEAINLRGDFDLEAMDQLAAMGPAVVPHLKDEVHGASFNRDELYRIAIVKVLERIEGQDAFDVLLLTARDMDPRVRANTYVSLKVRALAAPGEREQAVSVLVQMALQEPEPVAQSYALSCLDELEALDGIDKPAVAWRLITTLRAARAKDPLQNQIRASALKGLRLLSGKDEAALPFDNDAEPETRDQQVKAWEAWYVEVGGEVPQGEDWETWKSKVDEAGSSDQADGGAAPADEPVAPPAPEESQ